MRGGKSLDCSSRSAGVGSTTCSRRRPARIMRAAAADAGASGGQQSMMPIRGWVIVVALGTSAFAAPGIALACGCTPVLDRPVLTPLAEVQEQLAWADQVFLGRVSARTDTSITFDVEAFWKGQGARQQTLVGGAVLPNGTLVISDCDFGFESDVRYVVFAAREARGLTASSCGLSRPFEQAAALLQLLDRVTPRRAVPPG